MTYMTESKIEKLCDRITELIHNSEGLDGINFLDSLVEIDKYCAEILGDEEKALQNERFKSLVIYKCRLFDRKKAELKNSSEFTKDDYLEICKKFRDYKRTDNRILLRIEDEIEGERQFYLENGFSNEELEALYRIKDYNRGKYTVRFNLHNYSELSIDQLYKELEEEKEELEELEEELEELKDLDEEDYDEYDFESEEEYTERLEDLEDDIYFCKCNIELIETVLEEKSQDDFKKI